ncbi:MAG: sulfotransferase domain-containing protein [Pseudomonadota bacterium]|uniref:sulfotransferase domain-containing protein n=1 Tax=Roseovarius TaxID=74030 RepID=UPI0022A80EB6|nr:sulfotransferase domain-containing protein [Roseovarius sp. EGI FJ00037]MCZ0812897.1 sulfotransferase domain-containing protein [Roseovarius sp. EGI FJ00037]
MSDLRRIIWLASYPKSGNTWMRSLLAHYFMPKGKAPDINNLRQFTTGDVRKDFFDAAAGGHYQGGSVEEWVRLRPKVLRLIAGSKPDHHFVKTHCQASVFLGEPLIPADVTAAAIYMMRNPFDVAPSFARHQAVDLDTAIGKMCDIATVTGAHEGIYDALGRWDDHVRSWTEAPGLPLHVIRYEDMLARPAPTVRKLLEKFLRVKVDKPKLAYAVKSTSFQAMKAQEATLGFTEKPRGMQSFFAKGQAGAWREDLTPAQVARLREAFLPALETHYPELLAETLAFAARG